MSASPSKILYSTVEYAKFIYTDAAASMYPNQNVKIKPAFTPRLTSKVCWRISSKCSTLSRARRRKRCQKKASMKKIMPNPAAAYHKKPLVAYRGTLLIRVSLRSYFIFILRVCRYCLCIPAKNPPNARRKTCPIFLPRPRDDFFPNPISSFHCARCAYSRYYDGDCEPNEYLVSSGIYARGYQGIDYPGEGKYLPIISYRCPTNEK